MVSFILISIINKKINEGYLQYSHRLSLSSRPWHLELVMGLRTLWLVHATLKPDIVLHPSMDMKVDDLLRKLVKPSTVTNNTDHGQGSSATHGTSNTQGAPTMNQE